MVLQQNPEVATKPITSESTNGTAANGIGAITGSTLSPNPSSLKLTPKNHKKTKFNIKSLPYLVFGITLLGIGGIAFASYQTSKESELRSFQDELAVNSKVVDTEFELTKDSTISLAAAAKTLYDLGNKTPEAYNRLSLEFFLKRPRFAMAHSIGQAPFKLVPTTKWFWGYFYADQGKKEQVGQSLAAPNTNVIYSELFKDDDYPTKDYWTIPFNSGKPAWIEPYTWYGINMTSYQHVFRDAKGEILGMSNADLNITEMVKLIKDLKTFNPNSYNVLITEKGTIVTYPPDPKMGENRENIQKVPELSNIWSKISKDKQGLIIDNGKAWAYKRLPSNDWVMLEAVPENSLYGELIFQHVAVSMIAGIFLSVIFILYLRTLKQSGSLAVLLGIQERITERQKVETRMAEILAEVSRASNPDELDAPLSRYMAEIRQELNCDRVVVYRFMDDRLGGTRGIIVAEDGLAHLTNAKAAGLSDPCIPLETLEAYKHGRIVAINDVFKEGCIDPAHINLMHLLQIKSNLIVPVIRAGELDSLLIAHFCDRQHNWQESEIVTLKQLADEIGRAISGVAILEQQRLVADQERNRSEAIQRELIRLLSDVEGAVSGDLTVRAQISAGEIGIVADFFNAIVESLREVVSQVKQTTLQVNTSVNSNNESIRGLAKDATSQAAQLDSALQSVAEMTDSMQLVALSAQQAADASSQAADTAEIGSVEIEQSVKSILQLRNTVDDTAKKVKRLGEASKQISKVVVLIDQIALKTNMLALNASVEAARAGEEGRGFAVVAAEVGALAAQSATATREIGRLVEGIQLETNEVVQAMQASTVQVAEGTNRVEDARKSLNQIMEISRKVNTLFQEISLATTSQVQTSQSVRSLMSDLSTQSQRSSETSRDVAISLQGTADVANQLQSSVETFKV